MTPQEVVGYQQQFTAQLSRAYRWDLWGAAYLMEGGCSDDGFDLPRLNRLWRPCRVGPKRKRWV
jgi:hypothetical protein